MKAQLCKTYLTGEMVIVCRRQGGSGSQHSDCLHGPTESEFLAARYDDLWRTPDSAERYVSIVDISFSGSEGAVPSTKRVKVGMDLAMDVLRI